MSDPVVKIPTIKLTPVPGGVNVVQYGTLTIGSVETLEAGSDVYKRQVYTLTSIYQILPVAYNECAKDKEEKQTVANLIDSELENGASITDFGLLIMKAILETGIFGKKQEQKKPAQKKNTKQTNTAE